MGKVASRPPTQRSHAMFPVRHFRRAGAFRGVALLVTATFCFLVLATGTASSAPADGPQRDHGRGHWFKRPCAVGAGRVRSCDAQVVTNATGTRSPRAHRRRAPSAPPSSTARTRCRRRRRRARRSPSSTPTTTRTSRPTSPRSTQYGLPACTTANGCFRKVNQTGGTSYPATNTGWGLEIALDVETAHAICQNCKILLVEASSTRRTPTSAPPRTRRSRSARTSSRTPGAAASRRPRRRYDTVLQPPWRRRSRLSRATTATASSTRRPRRT